MAAHKKRKKHLKAQPKKKDNWRKGKCIKSAYAFVKERDGHICKMCGCPIELTVHHLQQGSEYPALRYDTQNLVTLCNHCHVNYHKIWNGYSKAKSINLDTFLTYLYLNEYFCNGKGEMQRNMHVVALIDDIKKRKPYLEAIANGELIEVAVPELVHA